MKLIEKTPARLELRMQDLCEHGIEFRYDSNNQRLLAADFSNEGLGGFVDVTEWSNKELAIWLGY